MVEVSVSALAGPSFTWRVYDPHDGQWAEIVSSTGLVNRRGPGPFSAEMAMVVMAMCDWCKQSTNEQASTARRAFSTK